MKTIPFFIAATLIAQEAPPMPASAPIVSEPRARSTLIIDPKARSNDLIQAFDQLRKDKPTLKILVRTASGSFSNVTDMTATTGGTLLLIKVLSNQGTRTQVVPIEEVMELNYSP